MLGVDGLKFTQRNQIPNSWVVWFVSTSFAAGNCCVWFGQVRSCDDENDDGDDDDDDDGDYDYWVLAHPKL